VFPDERFQWLQARGIHGLDPIGARMRSRAPRPSKPIIPNGRVVTPAPHPAPERKNLEDEWLSGRRLSLGFDIVFV
jgi:hypothetical protein